MAEKASVGVRGGLTARPSSNRGIKRVHLKTIGEPLAAGVCRFKRYCRRRANPIFSCNQIFEDPICPHALIKNQDKECVAGSD